MGQSVRGAAADEEDAAGVAEPRSEVVSSQFVTHHLTPLTSPHHTTIQLAAYPATSHRNTNTTQRTATDTGEWTTSRNTDPVYMSN